MKKEFSPDDYAHLKDLVAFIGQESADEQDTWKGRALVTISMLRDSFPDVDDTTLAGFCAALTYVMAEISFAKVAEAGKMINVIYMSYSLALAHLLGVYDAATFTGTPEDAGFTKMPETPGRHHPYPGQYL